MAFAEEYQRQVVPFCPAEAVSVVLPSPQRLLSETVGSPGVGFTVTVNVMVLSQPSAFSVWIVYVPDWVMLVPRKSYGVSLLHKVRVWVEVLLCFMVRLHVTMLSQLLTLVRFLTMV